MRNTGLVLFLLSLIAVSACTNRQNEPTATRPAIAEWRDATGAAQHPLAQSGKSATVLLFISPDCPISNTYAPEIRRIAETYAAKDVAFFGVHSDPRVSPAIAKEHADAFGYTFPVLMDPTQELARFAGATVTPESVVVDRSGKIIYAGRIDDLYFGFGKRRQIATTHELRDVLDAVTTGKPVPAFTDAPAVGCEIPAFVKRSQILPQMGHR